jgi:hypothetical protein
METVQAAGRKEAIYVQVAAVKRVQGDKEGESASYSKASYSKQAKQQWRKRFV